MSPSTSPQWHAIRPWAPSLSLAVREITSVSATFILSSTVSDREIDPSLASRGLIAASEENPQESDSDEPVASSSAISLSSSSSGTNEEVKSRSFITNALAKGLSVTVNGSPWPRAFIRVDEQSDEAVIIIYALMPGRQYDVELALIPNGQPTDNSTTNLNRQIMTEEDSDNAPSEIQTDPESPGLEHSTPSDPHSTPSTSPSRTMPGTPTTVPQITLEEQLNHLQQTLAVVNAERETLLASLKAARKDAQKADSALRSEIDILKRSSERHALAEARGRQKVLALQEAVKRAQNATKAIEEKVKELQEEVPILNKQKDEKEKEYEILKKEAEKVRKEREALEEKERKREEAMKADLAGLTVKLEKLGAKKEKLETGIVPELEQKLKEIEKEIEVEEQNLLKLEREESERNANAQNQYQQYQQYHLQQQQQQRQRQRNYHNQNHSDDYPSTASSVPIQRPRHQSSELPTPIGRPTPAPIQRPTQSDLTSSTLGYSVAGSTIWTQSPTQPQLHSHHPQISQRPPLPVAQQQHTHPTFSPQLLQLHNPRSLSLHNSTVPSAGNPVQRRSSLKNPSSAPFSSTNHYSFTTGSGGNTPASPSSKSVSSSPTRSSASIMASSSTLSSKAPAFEPTRSMSLNTRMSSGVVIKNPNANVTPNVGVNTNNDTANNASSSSSARGKSLVSKASTSLQSPIQRPVVRGTTSGGDNGNGSDGSGHTMQGHRHAQRGLSYGGGR
ncbi:hypothetical protein BYT27DRAFT_7170171 [Phlegmacium glaucopus]|nr:hypothetical protein BYT27DRAFT_7170171 [Phlegmacium glaucopus]